MEQKWPQKHIVILVLIIVVGTISYISFQSKSTKPSEENSIINIEIETEQSLNKTVTIGLIVSKSESYSTYKTFAKEILEKDMNYISSSVGSDINFILDVRDAQGEARTHLEHVIDMKEEGVNLIIGGMWSSHACAALSYCTDNNIILFSPSSRSPLPALPNDSLFRLSIIDLKEVDVIYDVLNDRGVQALIVLQRADSWADALYANFADSFKRNGGTIVERIRYISDPREINTTEVIQQAETVAVEAVEAYGWDKVAVELLGYGEAAEFFAQLDDYPVLYNLTWYGSTASYNLPQVITNSTRQADKVKLVSISPIMPDSKLRDDLLVRFENHTGQVFDFNFGCTYDITMIFARTVVGAEDLETETLTKGIQNLCMNYTGVTGSCRLDEADDRAAGYFGVYEYGYKEDLFGCWIVGEYTDTGLLKWYPDV